MTTLNSKTYQVTVTQSVTVRVKALCETDVRYIVENNEEVRNDIRRGLEANGIEITDIQEEEPDD